jgi:Rod binding domain-containing protein
VFQQLVESAKAPGAESRHDTARTAAAQLVSSAFVLPVLEAMREDPLGSDSGPFAPGAAEKRFGPLLDQQFADRITSASNFPLIDAIVSRYQDISAKVAPSAHGLREAIDVEG